jgi:hypothetical protein
MRSILSDFTLILIFVIIGCHQVAAYPAWPIDVNSTINYWNPGAKCVSKESYLSQINPTCVDYIVHDSIYIDDAQYIRDKTLSVALATVGVIDDCALNSIRTSCALTYRECFEVKVPGYEPLVPVGTRICKSYCQQFSNSCISLFVSDGYPLAVVESLLSCDDANPAIWGIWGCTASNTAFFPSHNYTVPITFINDQNITMTANFSLDCYDENENVFAGYGQLVCPSGTHEESSTACALNCPEPLITDSEYSQAKLMISIVGWFSFILTAFVVISYLLMGRKPYMYPHTLVFCFVSSVMCLSWAFCLGSMIGHENMWCSSPEIPNRWGNGWCTVQGVTFVYFTLSSALWWLSICVNLCLMVIFRYQPEKCILYKYNNNTSFSHGFIVQIVLQVLCWGIPLIVIIITLSAHKIGYGASDFWCTIQSGENLLLVSGSKGITTSGVDSVQQVDIWNLILLTIPVICITCIGAVILTVTVIFAWFKSKSGIKFLIKQWRLVALLSLYIWIYTFVFSYHIQFTSQRQNQYDFYASYINCLKESPILGGTCDLKQAVNFPLWFIASFNAVGQGCLVFVIFGTSSTIFNAWRNLFRRMARMSPISSGSTGTTDITGTEMKFVEDEDIMEDYELSDEDDTSSDEESSLDTKEQVVNKENSSDNKKQNVDEETTVQS